MTNSDRLLLQMGLALPDARPFYNGDFVIKPVLIAVDDQAPNLAMIQTELRRVRFL